MIKVIICQKEFDVIMDEMDEMMDDINNYKPSHLSLNVSGVLMEFDGVTITLHNGYLKIKGEDGVSLIKYKNIDGYEISNLLSSHPSLQHHIISNIDEVMDEYNKISTLPSTLPSSFLNMEIPSNKKREINESFICECDGCDVSDIYEDEWRLETLNYRINSNKTYGDLNECFKSYKWDIDYPSFIVEEMVKNGDIESLDELKWINDIIKFYVDEDEIWSDNNE